MGIDLAGNHESTDSSVYKTLLESTNAIPWRIAWDSQRFTYIGPQIERLLGWPQDSWESVQDWADRIHEEDRERVVNYCVSQSSQGLDHEADYRALTRDGNSVWMRDVVHVVRDGEGNVEALIGFMFDIDERKRNDQELARLRRKLEDLSYTDGLTSVANRRRFDAVIQSEWVRAQQQGTHLSMAMVDIDYFKEFNDRFGHLEGDECLKKVASILATMANRPRDLVARFGGDEFSVILPETDASGAEAFAKRCRESIRQAGIPNPGSPDGPSFSISVGVGTIKPGPADRVRPFIKSVDNKLYCAKDGGRDRVVAGKIG